MHVPMPHPSAPLTARDRVLLVRLGAVGDVLRTLPALHLIRTAYPSIHLAWIVEDLSRDLIEGHPEVDEVIRFPRGEPRGGGSRPASLLQALAGLRRDLRARGFTVALDFQGSLKSGILAWLSSAPRRVGFAPGHSRELSFLLTNEWVRPASWWLNRVERNLVMAEALGAPGDEITMILPERAGEGARAEAILRDAAPGGEPVVLLSPGTSLRQRYKRWPADHFARLAALLRRSLGAAPLVTWGPGEEPLARVVVGGSAGAARLAPAIPLRLLAALLRRSALFIGADSGPMHLAWGVGCPVVALFGRTDPRLNAPLGDGHVVLRNPASPASIAPEDVLAAARGLLQERRPVRGPADAPHLSRRLVFHATAGPPP